MASSSELAIPVISACLRAATRRDGLYLSIFSMT